MTLGRIIPSVVLAAGLAVAGAAGATTYTSDTNLADFTSSIGQIGTFTNFYAYYNPGDPGAAGAYGNVSAPPYTPTIADIDAGLRVIGNGDSPAISVAFTTAVASIRVFDNIDHYGSAYDGYQYTILGSNDGVSFTTLYTPLSTNPIPDSSEPYQLGAYNGTAPDRVNNVLTPGSNPYGTVGYIADFSFGTAYKYYDFTASPIADSDGNTDQELSAVAAVPEPATWAMMLVGFGGLGAAVRARRKSATATA